MIECKEFVGKVVSTLTIYENNTSGPEICIEFTDGTVFSSCLKNTTALEAKLTRNQGGQPELLRDYSIPLTFR